MKNKVYIGSLNPVKVKAVELILTEYDYHVIALDVSSGVGKQPLNDNDTLQGAINRAYQLPFDGLRFGLEAGVEILNNQLYLTNFGALIDEQNKIYTAGGTRLPLPNVIRDLIFNEHYELSEAMEKYYLTQNIKHKEGAIGYFTNQLVLRVDIFTHLVKLLFGQYLYNINLSRNT